MPRAAVGTLQYDPRILTESGEIFDPWWLILVYEEAVLERWRAAVEQEDGIRLSYPRWGAHISVVSGEPPRFRNRWGARDGERIAFEYQPVVETDGIFYWLPVRCEALHGIRSRLGLARRPRNGFHMTLGRIKR